MSFVDGLRHRLHVLMHGDRYTLDLLREIRFHRELGGQANRDFGNETYYREEVHRLTPLAWLERIRQDLRYAVRGLRHAPGFTAAVVLTLALGIGVNAAMLSLLRRVFVNPPTGVVKPDELRRLYLVTHGTSGNSALPSIRYPQFLAMRAAIDSTIRVALFSPADSTSIRDGDARTSIRISRVNDEYFGVLGVRPVMGRFFDPAEGRVEDIAPVIVLSNAYWRRAFGANAGIIGTRVSIRAAAYTVIGVAPPEFNGPDIDAVDAWAPLNTLGLTSELPWYQTMGPSFKMIVRPSSRAVEARLLAQSEAAIRTVRILGFYYDSLLNIVSGPIVEAAGPVERAAPVNIATRVAAVAFIVLIIVVANVTNLLLLRASRRSREIAVRRALGVSRGRLIEQMTVESLVLALSAGAIAVLFALWAGVALRRLVLADVHWTGPALDLKTVLSVAAVAIAIAFITGLVTSAHAMSPELSHALKSGARSEGKGVSALRGTLLVAQAALSLGLVAASGLFLRSLDAVASIGVGYDTHDRMFYWPGFDELGRHDAQIRAAFPEAARRLKGVPGVEAIGYGSKAPPIGGAMFWHIIVPGYDTVPQLPEDYGPSVSPISPGYVSASGLRLIQGRDFTDADRRETPGVVLVGESMARLYWPGERAIGKCFYLIRREGQCYEVVGIVSDAHRRGIIEAPIAQFYVPLAQHNYTPLALAIHVTPGREGAVRREVNRVLRDVLPDVAVVRAISFDSVIEPYLRPWRLGATLFSALGLLALAVAAVGIYSVIAYGVGQRGQEMAVRIALGAQRRDILDLVLRDGFALVAAGIAIGIISALIAGRFVASLLFGVVPNDVSVLLSASLIIGVVGAAGCLIPGWRAARADPVHALRAE